jgi:fucose 4-O-acetylase-like acetyltransferase
LGVKLTRYKTDDAIPFIGVARGVAIVLVVFGHALVPEIRNNSAGAKNLWLFIYSFHMPIFAMLSGYLFEFGLKRYEQGGFKKFTAAKFKALMVPYFVFSAISYVGINLAFRVPALAGILKGGGYSPTTGLCEAVVQILFCQNQIDKHIWFVYALFLVFLISYLLRSFLRSWGGVLATFAVLLLSHFFALPELLYRVVSLLPYFTLSRQMILVERLVLKKNILPSAFFFALSYTALFITRLFPETIVISYVFEIFAACSGGLFVLIASRVMADTVTAKAALCLGVYSYGIYLIHQPFVIAGMSGILLKFTNLPYPVICTGTFILGIGLPMLICRFVINRFRPLRMLLLGNFSKAS